MIMLTLLATAAASIGGLTELPSQKLLRGRCVTFLWTKTESPMRIAMLDEMAGTIRIARGKQQIDLARNSPTSYAGGGITVTVNVDFAERQGLTNGAIIDSGVVRVDVNGEDSVVLPVGGIRACQQG